MRKAFRKSNFIDSLKFRAKGGAGGNGQPKYGGVGGKGGSVICEVKPGTELGRIKDVMTDRILTAKSGDHSTSTKLLGREGEDNVLEIPPGITAYDENGLNLGELNETGETLILARGGLGGNNSN